MTITIPDFVTKRAVVRPDLLAETPDPETDVTAEEWNELVALMVEIGEALNAGGTAAPSDANPADLGTSASPGTDPDYSRADHVHKHGDLAGGSLHAAAIASGAAGFMSGADKAKLDGIETGADVTDFANVSAALGAASGNVSLNGNKLTSVDGPTTGTDAANKTYTDDQDAATYAAAVAAATAATTPEDVSGTTRAIVSADHGKTLRCTNASGCEIQLDNTITPGTTVLVVQEHASGPVTVADAGGMALRVAAAFEQTPPTSAEQYSAIAITILTSSTALITGDLLPA